MGLVTQATLLCTSVTLPQKYVHQYYPAGKWRWSDVVPSQCDLSAKSCACWIERLSCHWKCLSPRVRQTCSLSRVSFQDPDKIKIRLRRFAGWTESESVQSLFGKLSVLRTHWCLADSVLLNPWVSFSCDVASFLLLNMHFRFIFQEDDFMESILM